MQLMLKLVNVYLYVLYCTHTQCTMTRFHYCIYKDLSFSHTLNYLNLDHTATTYFSTQTYIIFPFMLISHTFS
jgi:hypothetical protein